MTTSSRTSDEGLLRGIRKWDLVAVAINAVIGAGIFGLPAKVYSLIGSYSLIAFVVCALVVMLIILCFAEVGSRFDETGGPYLYAREAFGPTVAFEVGWLIWLARLTAFAANCNLMVSYLAYFWPAANTAVPRAVTIAVVVAVLTALNILGVRQAAIASDLFTVGKLLPMLIFIGIGLFFLNPHAFALAARPSTGAFSQSVLLLLYAFTGFEMAAIPAGEIRDPQKHLPRALLIATAVVAFTYILIQVVCIGTLPELARSSKPLADAGQRFMGAAGGAIISAGAIISIAGNLNIVLLSGSRVPFAIAEQRQLPSFLARVHRRFFTPHVAIMITAGVMLVLTLKSSFVAALTISAIARLVTYAVTCAALPVLRRKTGVPTPVFRVRGGPVIAIAALILAVWLLLNSTFAEARAAMIAALVGIVIYASYRQLKRVLANRLEESRIAESLQDYLRDASTRLPEPLSLAVVRILTLHETQQGVTFNFFFGDVTGQPLFAACLFPEFTRRLSGRSLPSEALDAFIGEHVDLLKSDPRIALGTWYNEQLNQIELDIVFLVSDRSLAIELGRQYNQIGVFDLARNEDIETGGTGTIKAHWPDLNARLIELRRGGS